MHSESTNFSAIDSLDKYLLSVNHVARHCSQCEEYISEQVKHPSCLYGTYIQVPWCRLAVWPWPMWLILLSLTPLLVYKKNNVNSLEYRNSKHMWPSMVQCLAHSRHPKAINWHREIFHLDLEFLGIPSSWWEQPYGTTGFKLGVCDTVSKYSKYKN